MENTRPVCPNGWIRAFIGIVFLWAGMVSDSVGQWIAAPAEVAEEGTEGTRDYRISVAVEEVRIDAVVLDRRGHPVTDLTAEEFEVYQDERRQQISSVLYIDNYQGETVEKPAASKSSPSVSIPPARMTPDKVRRTIAFVVDDLSMGFENVHFARMALERFVKNEMQPGDLVAVLRTSRGVGALQLFSSDKRQLLAMIKNVRWGVTMGVGYSQMMAISYCIRALKDMPGRKYLMLLTTQVSMPSYGYANYFDSLADAALRAGVVIHTMDIKGLEIDPSPNRSWQQAIPLSYKTGGLLIENSNFFVTKSGIGRVNEQIKGYYLISYIPPSNTFKSDKRGIYHRIRIKVKRRGTEVHTRDGFFGAPGPLNMQSGPRSALRDAIFSPFRYNDLKVQLAFGYVEDSSKGYLLRSWLHVDADPLSIVEDADGAGLIRLEAACVTSDVNDFMQGAEILQYAFRIKKENIAWVRKHGLKFSVSFPVKKPGPYYVRAAVKDADSGKLGSVYQFMEIPDLKKRRLSLSSLFVIDREEDAVWVQAPKTDNDESDLQPDMRRDPRRSPAFRSYRPGESFEYMAVVYNAKSKEGANPDLECRHILYRDGIEVQSSEPEAVDLGGMSDFKRIPIRKKVFLDAAAPPGDYALQLVVTDKQAKEKYSVAEQAVDFEILPDSSPNPPVN